MEQNSICFLGITHQSLIRPYVISVGALTDDMIRQIDAIFEEVGDAEHINEEYATQDMII